MQRVALVTGSNRGVGRAIVAGLASMGYRVLLTARQIRQARAEAATLQAMGLAVHPHPLDVTSPASVAALTQAVETTYGRLDVLVNNAAVLYDDRLRASTMEMDLVAATMDTNLMGPWRMCQAFLPLMLRKGYGRIVNLSSEWGSFAVTEGGAPAYCVSKAALNMLTLKLSRELAGTGVLVNACCPGWVQTEMGGPGAELSPEAGADTPVWLATLPDDGPTGGFFQNRRPLPW